MGALGRKQKCVQGFRGKPEVINQFEDLRVGGRLVLKFILRAWDGEGVMGLMWLWIRVIGGLL
jgi:hypothetical protein